MILISEEKEKEQPEINIDYIVLPSISVTIYVNHNCSCGILLNPKKIEQLPNQFGPGPYQKVLREVIQSCVDCAKHEKQVYNFIQDGSGKIVITGTCLSVFYIHLV